jgi:hypothetical protein
VTVDCVKSYAETKDEFTFKGSEMLVLIFTELSLTNITIAMLDTSQHPVFYLKHDISKTGMYLRL